MNAVEESVRAALGKLTIAFEHELSDLEGTVRVFSEALRDIAPLDIAGAVTRVIRSERFFPRPSILRGHALEEQLSRTVWVNPKTYADKVCPLCGAEGFWYRGVQQPDRDETKVPAKVVASGEHKGVYVERLEILHDVACKIKHRSQGISLSNVA